MPPSVYDPVALLTAIASAVSAIAAAAALWALRNQLRLMREDAKLTRAAMQATIDSHVYARLDTLNQLLITETDVAKALHEQYQPKSPTAVNPAENLADMFFTLIEQLHKQRALYKTPEPLIPDDQWEAWEHTIRHTLKIPFLRTYWQQSASTRYGTSFQAFMSQILRTIDT